MTTANYTPRSALPARPPGNPTRLKTTWGLPWRQSTSDAFRVVVGHHMDFSPTRIPVGSCNFLTFISFPSLARFGGKHSLFKPSFEKLEMEKMWLHTNPTPSFHSGCRRMTVNGHSSLQESHSQISILTIRAHQLKKLGDQTMSGGGLGGIYI